MLVSMGGYALSPEILLPLGAGVKAISTGARYLSNTSKGLDIGKRFAARVALDASVISGSILGTEAFEVKKGNQEEINYRNLGVGLMLGLPISMAVHGFAALRAYKGLKPSPFNPDSPKLLLPPEGPRALIPDLSEPSKPLETPAPSSGKTLVTPAPKRSMNALQKDIMEGKEVQPPIGMGGKPYLIPEIVTELSLIHI